MIKRNWDNKKIIKEIKENGYYIFKNFFDEESLNEIKSSLLKTLHYIKKMMKQTFKKNIIKLKNTILNLKEIGMIWRITILLYINTYIQKM